jgi:hypothetical protein
MSASPPILEAQSVHTDRKVVEIGRNILTEDL